MKHYMIYLLLISFSGVHAKTYYVDQSHSSANDSNSGTLNSPWKTIQHAAETLEAGDTVFIRQGVYYENIYFENSGNATAGHIIFSAYNNETPIIDGNGVDAGNGIIIDKSYIKLIGLEVRNWRDNAIWMENASYIEISDCDIHDVVFGIGAGYGSHDLVFNRTIAHHYDLYGFDLSPSDGSPCYNATFNECIAHTGRDPQQNVDGFALGHGEQHDFVLNKCTTYNVFDGFDISSKNTTLDQCCAYNCWWGGYKIWQDNIKLVNCLGYNNDINVELDWDEEPGTTTLINCTFINGKTWNVSAENPGDKLRMYNCILAGGDNIGFAFDLHDDNYLGDYNIFHCGNSERVIVSGGYEDEFNLSQVSAGEWTSYSGQDAHSITINNLNDLFVNPANSDWHLLKNCPAIDKGTSLNAPNIDYEGNIRPYGAGYDIGAFEYQSGTALDKQTSQSNSYKLFQNYPNPFNPVTQINYQLPMNSDINLSVYDQLGRKVTTLVSEKQAAGVYTVSFDGSDLASGIYICRIEVCSDDGKRSSQVRKMILMK